MSITSSTLGVSNVSSLMTLLSSLWSSTSLHYLEVSISSSFALFGTKKAGAFHADSNSSTILLSIYSFTISCIPSLFVIFILNGFTYFGLPSLLILAQWLTKRPYIPVHLNIAHLFLTIMLFTILLSESLLSTKFIPFSLSSSLSSLLGSHYTSPPRGISIAGSVATLTPAKFLKGPYILLLYAPFAGKRIISCISSFLLFY
jgi:hypothetical protein